jgi:hypothetical protein
MMFSGLALAAVEDGEPDTNLVVGLDGDNGILVFGVSDTDGELDCTVPDDAPLTVIYGEPEPDGKVPTQPVSDLQDDGTTVEFFPPTEEGEDPGTPVAYGDEGAEDCLLTGASIAGKKGQINHGKVVSAMAKLIDGPKGCLMRHIAGSELGKGDQQVKPSDIVDEPVLVDPADPMVMFTNIGATCDKAEKENPGQLKKAERAASAASDTAPGNSGNAKGKNKNKNKNK